MYLNPTLRKKIIKETLFLGDQIVESCDLSSSLCWDTPMLSGAKCIYSRSESLYSGDSGIILFLRALVEFTNDNKYSEVLSFAIGRLFEFVQSSNSNLTNEWGYYTGFAGAYQTIIENSAFLKNGVPKNDIVELYCSNLAKLNFNSMSNELLSGLSGLLFSISYIYNLTMDKRLIDFFYEALKALIKNTCFVGSGVFWDRHQLTTKPLCGLAHGVSGISHVLIEIGSYIDSKYLKNLGVKGYNYERLVFSKDYNNWPDFRTYCDDNKILVSPSADILREIASDGIGKDMNAWCHGATGIGLCRLQSLNHTSQANIQIDLDNSIKKTISDLESTKFGLHTNYTLCHGLLGNIWFLAKIHQNKESIESIVNTTLQNALQQRVISNKYQSGLHMHDGKDLGLMMGTSGIGIAYLNLLSKSSRYTPLLPTFDIYNDQARSTLNLQLGSSINSIIRDHVERNLVKQYPITYDFFSKEKQTHGIPVQMFLNNSDNSFSDVMKKTVRKTIACSDNQKDEITMAYRFENSKNMIYEKIDNDLLRLFTEIEIHNSIQRCSEMDDLQLSETSLVLNPALIILDELFTDLSRSTTFISVNKVAILKKAKETITFELPYKSLYLLSFFSNQQSISKVFDDIKSSAPTDYTVSEIKIYLFKQIREYIACGLIVDKPSSLKLTQILAYIQ